VPDTAAGRSRRPNTAESGGHGGGRSSARRWAAIDADIVAIGRCPFYDHFDRVQRFEERGAFFGTGFEQVGMWRIGIRERDQATPGSVPQPIRKFVAEEDAVGWRVAEETGCSIGTGNGVVSRADLLGQINL